jgi:AcrR family transcriptional regulator
MPARSRNPRGQGDRLRADLLAAAARLIAACGDSRDLTLRRLAREVGIAVTSVYLHFPDLETLKAALVVEGHERQTALRDAALDGLDEPVARLLAGCRVYCRFAVEHPGHYKLMYGPELPPELAFDASTSPGRLALQGLADRIARCPRTTRDEDPLVTATCVWIALHGIASLRIDRPSFPWPPLDPMVESMVARITGVERRPQ